MTLRCQGERITTVPGIFKIQGEAPEGRGLKLRLFKLGYNEFNGTPTLILYHSNDILITAKAYAQKSETFVRYWNEFVIIVIIITNVSFHYQCSPWNVGGQVLDGLPVERVAGVGQISCDSGFTQQKPSVAFTQERLYVGV